MKRAGGLHPARPDCWPPTKRPGATPGGLIAASVTCLSRREGVSPCLRTSPPLNGTLEVQRTSWRILFPRHACVFLLLGFRGAWVSHAPPPVPKQRRPYDAALPLVSGSRLARSPAWHALPQCLGYGHWVSYCCVAFVLGPGLCLGLGFGNPASSGWGLGWVCLGTVCGFAPLFPAGVCGVCGWACISVCTVPVFDRVLGRAWLCARSSCSPPFPVLVCGAGARAGVRVSAAPRLSWGGCWGVCVLVCPSWVVSGTSWVGVRCGGGWLALRCCRAPPVLAGVLGRVCVSVRAPLVPRLSWVGSAVWACVLGSGFGCAPFLLVGLLGCACGRACAPLDRALPGGPPVVWGCASVAVGGVCPLPSPLVSFWAGGFVMSVAGCPGLGPCGLCPPIPSLPGHVVWRLFSFFRPSVVCLRVFWVSLLPVGRCRRLGVAGFGWVSPGAPLGGPVFGAVWVGVLAASCGVGGRCSGCGPFLRPPPCFFFGGGLHVPPTAFPGLAHALVGIPCGFHVCCWCLRFAGPCLGPVGRVGSVHVRLGAPSCRVRIRLCRVGGCAWRLCVALG